MAGTLEGFRQVQTTLADLGFKPQPDRFAVGHAKLTIVRLPRNGALNYLGFLDSPPFASHHFLNFLAQQKPTEKVSPFASRIYGVVDDLLLPDLAFAESVKQNYESSNARRDRLHRSDPLVGPHYIDFDISGSRRRWLMALGLFKDETREAESFLNTVGRLRFTNPAEQFDPAAAEERIIGQLKDLFVDPATTQEVVTSMIASLTDEQKKMVYKRKLYR